MPRMRSAALVLALAAACRTGRDYPDARTHRTATVATLQVGPTRVRVYSTHLGTIADIGGGRRREQLRAILDDAASSPLLP